MAHEITREEVQQVAKLARLKLDDSELSDLANQMSRVLGYVAVLEELDTSEVEPLVQAVETTNAFRKDEVAESLPREKALQNAPATDGECFLVPDILQKG
jgi:aspartyl-tRNA(Asn)/glutamyl-tRNA(Gln) amidotransferase subunit C